MKKTLFKSFAGFIFIIGVVLMSQSCAPSYSSEYFNRQNAKYRVTSQHSECPSAYWNSARTKRRR